MKHLRRAHRIVAAGAAVASLAAQSTSPRYTIAFKAFPPSNTDIFIAAADGSNARPLAPDPALDCNASFSPDGQWIVFTSHRAGSADLYRIRPDGSGLERLTDDPAFDQGAFSQVVYRFVDGSTRGLRILDVATKTARALDTGSSHDTFPSWSPRGDWIAFTSKRDGDYEIYRVGPDGTELQRLTRLPGPDAHPTFSADGEWIAFATGSQGFKDEAIGLVVGALPPQFQPYGEIAVMRADGSNFHALTDDAIEQGTPVWVPGHAASR